MTTWWVFFFLHNYVYSLLVSPDPRQPWLAVTTKSTNQLQVYDYQTHKLKYQHELGR